MDGSLQAHRDALLAALEFQLAAGLDLALDELPHDRFAEGPSTVGSPATAEPPAPERAALLRPADRPSPAGGEEGVREPRPEAARASQARPIPVSPDAAAADARRLAAAARSLDELRDLLAGFEGCSLRNAARQLVFSDGTPGAAVMILGEAPGADEDRTGRAFVGRAGQLLDRMLGAVGLDRTAVYLANVVPWRPPGNRTPTPQEVAVCLPFTLRQIELAAPRILVTLGSPATQTVLGIPDGIVRMRGRRVEHRVGDQPVAVFPMLHPAYLLRQPLHKRLAWRDLLALKRHLATSEPA